MLWQIEEELLSLANIVKVRRTPNYWLQIISETCEQFCLPKCEKNVTDFIERKQIYSFTTFNASKRKSSHLKMKTISSFVFCFIFILTQSKLFQICNLIYYFTARGWKRWNLPIIGDIWEENMKAKRKLNIWKLKLIISKIG